MSALMMLHISNFSKLYYKCLTNLAIAVFRVLFEFSCLTVSEGVLTFDNLYYECHNDVAITVFQWFCYLSLFIFLCNF
jgi:hypothetical protein